jgi:hypothetical protein
MVFKHTFIMTILIAITALYYPKRSFLVNGSNLISSSDISVFTVTINNSTKDLFEFMDEGLKYINKTNTKKNAVMVLGYLGTGKSTLVNYLNTEGSPNLSVYRVRTVPYRSVPYRTVPYRTVPYRTVPYRTLPFSARDHFGRPRSVPYFFDRFP